MTTAHESTKIGFLKKGIKNSKAHIIVKFQIAGPRAGAVKCL